MALQLIQDKKSGDYAVRMGGKPLGILYEKDCSELGNCWVFDVKTRGLFSRDVYFYSSPDLAKEWIPKEMRNKKQEQRLYKASAPAFY